MPTPDGQAPNTSQSNIAPESKKRPVVVNAASLDPKNPIPLNYGSDIFLMLQDKRYLPFLPMTDNMANTFWNARMLSTTHNACISTIAQTTVGEGVYVVNKKIEEVDEEFLRWIEAINNDEQSLNEICRLIMDCKGTDGNAWVEIVRGKVGSTPYVKPYVHTTLICRLGEIDKDEGRPLYVVKSNQFARNRTGMINARSLRAVSIPLYCSNPLDQKRVWTTLPDEKSGDEHTMIHLKNDIPGIQFYGMPRSTASLRYQVLEGKYAQYDLDLLDNEMVMAALLIFKQAMTEAEAQRNAREIIKTHTGEGRRGRVGVVASESGVEDFTYQQLETQKEGSFIEKDKRIEQKIITSHNWDAVLAGISRESSLGNGSNYIRSAFESRKVMVLQPEADYLVKKFLRHLVNIAADYFGKPDWKGYQLALKQSMPFSLMSDINVNAVLTKDEGREILNRAPLPDQKLGGSIIEPDKPRNSVPDQLPQ